MAQRDSVEPLLTAEQYARLPDDPAWRDELVRGRLVREPRPGNVHGRIQARLGGWLERYVSERGLGYVTVASGYLLEREPDTVRGPDIAFVARSRYGDTPPEKWPDFAPDLAIEVLSPTDRAGRMVEKVAQLFAAGARQVWLIDPEDRTAIVYTAAGEARVLRETDELAGNDIVPGFGFTLRALFEG
jgi:Uma2 family endonuclease